jgi:glycosyltransferase involved in cell wall biosynthesis
VLSIQTSLSIITVSSNDTERLRKTILSLAPGDARVEHIVVVPESDYKTRDFLIEVEREFNSSFHLVSDQAAGIYQAMAIGAMASCGKYFTFWNSGDYLDSREELEKLLFDLESETAPWVITDGVFDDIRSHRPTFRNLEAFILQKRGGYVSHQCVLFSKKAFVAQPFFNFSYRVAADTDQIFRLNAIAAPRLLPHQVVHVQSGDFSSKHHRRARIELFFVILKNLRGNQRVISIFNFFLTNFSYLLHKIARVWRKRLAAT